LKGLEIRDYGRRGSAFADHATPLYLQKLTLTSLTSSRRSVNIVRSRTKATELILFIATVLSGEQCLQTVSISFQSGTELQCQKLIDVVILSSMNAQNDAERP
jgi:hypothetical protein